MLLHPSAIRSAPLLEEDEAPQSALDAYVQDLLTVPASLAGVPALNVPCPPVGVDGDDGWPIGFSIIGQWGADEFVLSVGEAVASG